MEAQNLYAQYDNDLYNNHGDNYPVLQTFLPVMICPSDVDTDVLPGWFGAAPGSYSGVNSGGGAQYWEWPPRHMPYGGAACALTSDARGPLHPVVSGSCRFPPVITSQITDGLTNTVLVGERHSTTNPDNGPEWALTYSFFGDGSTQAQSHAHGLPDHAECGNIGGANCNTAFASLHSGNMMNFVTCAGNVIRISPNIDGNLFEGYGTIAGGEIVFLE